MSAFKNKVSIQIRYRDLDAQNHVNSSVYFSYFELSRVHFFDTLFVDKRRDYWADVNIVVAKQEMNYKQQLRLHDKAYSYVWVSRIGNKSFEMNFLLVKEEDGKEIEVASGMGVLVCINLKTDQTVPVPEEWKAKFLSLPQQA
jgi:acyl-CoA thioester hydrolase